MIRSFFIVATAALVLASCNGGSRKNAPRPLAKTATLALYAVSTTSSEQTITNTDPENGGEIYLVSPAVITSVDVESIHLTVGQGDDLMLNVKLTPNGAAKLKTATATANGMRLAFVVNDKVVSAPMVRSALSNTFVYTGGGRSNRPEAIYDALTKE